MKLFLVLKPILVWLSEFIPIPKVPVKTARGIIESYLFADNGRVMKWSDVKGLLIIPAIADAFVTLEEMEEIPDILYKKANIVFTRVKSNEPSISEKELIKEKLEQWLYENRYDLSQFGGFGYPIDITIDDYAFVETNVWAVGYLHGMGGYGHIFHSDDKGDSWEVQWKSGTYGPNPFYVEFVDDLEGFVATNGEILRTIDRGVSWDSIWERSGFGNWIRDFKVIDQYNLWCRNSGRNEFYLYSLDGGESWQVEYK